MNKIYRSLLTGSAVVTGMFFMAGPTQANLILSGSLIGVFQSSDDPNTSVTNSAVGDASFRTGIPVANSFQSGVVFNSEAFSNLVSGDEISLGMFTYYNGITKIGTSSGNAVLDLYLELTNSEPSRIFLTAMTFGIDATNNALGSLVPDNYTVSLTQPAETWIDGERVEFSIGGLSPVTSVAENTWKNVGSLTFTSTAGTAVSVAERGATALFLILGLVTILGGQRALRRMATRASWPIAS